MGRLENADNVIEQMTKIIGYIFSWVIILPVAVILSGKLLQKTIPFHTEKDQLFKIPLYILHVEANNGEVILGFTGFILSLVVVAFVGGADFYHYSVNHFGFDVGQFHTICFTSAIFTVVWSTILWTVAQVFREKPLISSSATKEVIEMIQNKDIEE